MDYRPNSILFHHLMFKQVPNTWLTPFSLLANPIVRVFLCTNTEISQCKPSLPREPHTSTDHEMGDSLFSPPPPPPSPGGSGSYLLPSCFWAWRAKRTKNLWYLLFFFFYSGFVVNLSKWLGEAKTCTLLVFLTFLSEGSRP